MNGKHTENRSRRRLLSAALALAIGAAVLTASPAAPRSQGQSGATIAPASRYGDVALTLESLIGREMREKKLPGFSIALVDNQRIVWARGFGYADPGRKTPATAETIYRAGAISRLFTDVAILRSVDSGQFSLDAPVGQYLPAFHPHNPFATPITLRELMSDRSGLVRDPPVGSIFDASSPSLVATTLSLNRTALVYWPSTHVKYSDAAAAVTGEVLERESGESFAPYMRKAVFEPMGMRDSSFAPDARIRALLQPRDSTRTWSISAAFSRFSSRGAAARPAPCFTRKRWRRCSRHNSRRAETKPATDSASSFRSSTAIG
jgi:CubicO group peptidase (beta-lactamase class C family)